MTISNFWGNNPSTTTIVSSPAPTQTNFTLLDATDFLEGQNIFVQVDGVLERTHILSKSGNSLTVSPALSSAPDVPGLAQSGRELITNSRLNSGSLFNAESVSELAAVDTTLAPDGLKYLIKNVGLYRFAFSSSATADNFMVIEPETGPGRWLLESTGNLWQIEAQGPSEATNMNPPADGVSWGSMFQRNQLQKLDLDMVRNGSYLFNNESERPQIYIDGRWYSFLLERADYDLSGTVTNTLSGSPESDVIITIDDTQQERLSDESGNYTISNVPKGTTVSMTATKDGYNSYSGTFNLNSSDAIKNFSIARRTISGVVTSSLDSSVVSDVTIDIDSIPRNNITDGSGNYSLIDVPDGIYTLEASKIGFVNYSSELIVTGDQIKNMIIDPIVWTVSGNLTSNVTGQMVEGAAITIGTRPAVNSNSSGFYSRNTVPDGVQSFVVNYPGYFSNYTDTVSVLGGNVTKNVVLSALERSIHSNSTFSPNGGEGYTYGFRFSTSRTLRVKKIGFYNLSGIERNMRVKLWNSSGGVIISQDVYSSGSSGWIYVTLSSPVTIYAGNYTLSGMLLSSGWPNHNHSWGGNIEHVAITPFEWVNAIGDQYPTVTGIGNRGYDIVVEM